EPNAFGVRDMHGLVEEWCHDWYGPYVPDAQSDPVGYGDGESRVTRGGSCCTDAYNLRSASRMAALPQDRSWVIGFRVVQGEMPATKALSRTDTPRYARGVSRKPFDWKSSEEAVFQGPIPFVREPDDDTPFYNHNHCPSIAWCPNGDLLAIWFSCRTEPGREMTILASRLRAQADQWEPASEFFDVADRNTTGSSLFHGTDGSLLHINGVGVSYGWMDLVMILRESRDNGATWSKPVLINPFHQFRNQPVSGAFTTADGRLMQICDAASGSVGGSALHVSHDNGRSWIDYGARMPLPGFARGETGGWIAGIHAGVAELDDGRLLALGRGNDIDGRMPMSVSWDGGRSWTYRASPFPPIASGQRLVLMKLAQGPVLLV
ncbi:MAG TPA: exo-alpha-sialidase, partial [Clostridia bacterium]|nr:exo-alpha-sialidase [Clostridia bacterium]